MANTADLSHDCILVDMAVTDTIGLTLASHHLQEMRESFKKGMEYNIWFLWIMIMRGIIAKLLT